jgi:hypothetical protein
MEAQQDNPDPCIRLTINHMKNEIGRLRLGLRQPPELSKSNWLMKAFEGIKNNTFIHA